MQYCAVTDRINHSVGFAYKRIDDEEHNNEHFIFEDYFISLKEQRKLKLYKINFSNPKYKKIFFYKLN